MSKTYANPLYTRVPVAVRNAVVPATFSTADGSLNEMTTQLSAALLAQCVEGMTFKNGPYDYIYTFGDSGSLTWIRRAITTQVATGGGGTSVTELVRVPNFAALPAPGEVSKLYITDDDDREYTWDSATSTYQTSGLSLTLRGALSAPNASAANPFVVSNDPRLAPQPTLGVQYCQNGIPIALYPTLSAAADAVFRARQTSGVLYRVFGAVVETITTYVKQPCTIELTAGSSLTAPVLALNYSYESQAIKRAVFITGHGTLNADINSSPTNNGVVLDVANITWNGTLLHKAFNDAGLTQGNPAIICEYNFRKVTGKASGKATVRLQYQKGGFYRSPSTVLFDRCNITNTDSPLVRAYGSDPDEGGANPNDPSSGNLLTLLDSTVTLATGQPLADTTKGGVTIVSNKLDGLDLTTNQMDAVMALTFDANNNATTTPDFSKAGQEFDGKGSDGKIRHYYCRRSTYVPGTTSGMGFIWHQFIVA